MGSSMNNSMNMIRFIDNQCKGMKNDKFMQIFAIVFFTYINSLIFRDVPREKKHASFFSKTI